MSTLPRLLVPPCLLACGLAAAFPAGAVEDSKFNYLNPAAACQLSIPTTDTQVRPKATGFRNESTSKSAFVICGFGVPANDSSATNLQMSFTSIDGAARTVQCTTVNGQAGYDSQIYSTKSISSTLYGSWSHLTWLPADFGGTTEIPNSTVASVTCTLPPQTAITRVYAGYMLEIGN